MLARLLRYTFIAVIVLILLTLFHSYFINSINNIENSFLDLKYKLKESNSKTIQISKYILLVTDDYATRQKLSYSPITQKEWNIYLEKLSDLNTKTIAFYYPIFFPYLNETITKEFQDILKTNNNIIMPYVLDNFTEINPNNLILDTAKLFHASEAIDKNGMLRYKKASLPDTKFFQYINFLGFSNLKPDSDGAIRKIPLIATLNDKIVFSYTLTTLISFLDIEPKSIKLKDHQLSLYSKLYKKNIVIPLTKRNEMYINFFSNIKKRFLQIPLYKILNGQNRSGITLNNHLVINVSTTSEGTQKYRTPVDPFLPGGLIVAAALNTIVSELFTKPRTTQDTIYCLFSLAIILIIAATFFSPTNKVFPFIGRTSFFILFSLSLIIIYPLFTGLIFTHLDKELNTFIPLFFIILYATTTSTYKLIIEDREKKLLLNTLRGFISSKKLDYLMTKKGSDLMLQTRKKEVSILLTDLVDFANWSTYHDPNFIFSTLKKYYSTLETIIFKHSGTIDKKMGDALLAFFGDLDDDPNHIEHAINAAIDIQNVLKKQNFPFLTRIGINTGIVMLGNLGTEKHLDYTAIGSAVNFSKRIESNCIPGKILLGPDSYSKLSKKNKYTFNEIEIELKETQNVLTCYSLDPNDY